MEGQSAVDLELKMWRDGGVNGKAKEHCDLTSEGPHFCQKLSFPPS